MKINRLIDHTLLKPEASQDQVKTLCQEALTHDFASVMVNSCNVKLCRSLIGDNDSVKVASVVGFPLGAMSTEAKVFEAKQAIQDGANELDMVINVGRLKEGDVAYVTEEIKAIKALIPNGILKVIIETCLLSDEEKIAACGCVTEAGADYIKTSTGFSSHGATVEDVKLLKAHVGPRVLVKASGGIRTHEDLIKMVEAGASRIGASAGVALLKE